MINWYQRQAPQSRKRIRRKLGLVAIITSALGAWYFWPSNKEYSEKTEEARTANNGDLSQRSDIRYVGDKYAIQKIGGYCEVIREVNNGKLGYIYDIPKKQHLDIDGRDSNREHLHKQDPRAVVIVMDADNPSLCRVVSQPSTTLPYRP